MKQIKRIVALVLALILVVGQMPTAAGTEPINSVIMPKTITAGSAYGGLSPENLGNNAGLTPSNPTDLDETTYNTTEQNHYWHTLENPGDKAWVLIDLGAENALKKLYIWNLNQWGHPTRDVKDIEIQYSANSTNGADGAWTKLGGTHTVAQSTPDIANKANLVVDFNVSARFVKIKILNSYGGNYWGLGKILFSANNLTPTEDALRALRTAYNTSMKEIESDYLPVSWTPLKEALVAAKTLLDAASVDVTALQAATTALTSARDGLQSKNIVRGATAEALAYGGYPASYAVDGDRGTRWAVVNEGDQGVLTLTLKKAGTCNQLSIIEYGNIKAVTVEYFKDSQWTAVTNPSELKYAVSKQLYVVAFDEVTAGKFRLILTTTTREAGLNVEEVILSNVPVITVTAEATNSGEEAAANLIDDNPQTHWCSNGNTSQSVITLTYNAEMVFNTVSINEAKDAVGTLTSITVESWNGDQWVTQKEASCEKLAAKKNVFFDDVSTTKVRITVNTKGNAVMKLLDISADQSNPADMPADTGLIELEPNRVANQYQAEMARRGYGMFIHFGINTFGENEWTYGDVDPSVYAPPQIDADQWVRTARNAGMSTILMVTKHHDGFALWDSAYTDYDVGNPKSGSHVDVLQAVSDACNKYGLNMGVYYSAWDSNWDKANGKANDTKYNQYARNQLSEIMSGKYGLKDETGKGVISELWIDGNWEKSPERWEFGKLYDTVKKLQPSCQVGLNWTINNSKPVSEHEDGDPIHYFPSDFRLADGQETGDNDPKLFTYRGQTYYLPFEATLILNSSWFWHTGYGVGASRAPDSIVEKYNKYRAEDNILVLNVGPNRDGRIEQADIDSLYVAARKLGIAKGDAVNRTLLDLKDELYGKNLAKGATGTSKETYSAAPGYAVENMFDGSNTSRWATDPGYEYCTAEITLPKETTFNTMTIREDATYHGAATSAALFYKRDNEWIGAAPQTALVNEQLTIILEEAITAQEIKLVIYSKNKAGPTLSEIELYQVGTMPEIEATLTSNTLRAGDRSPMTVWSKTDKINLNEITTFTTDNKAIATVNAQGVITAVAAGDTTITARVALCGKTLTTTLPIKVETRSTGGGGASSDQTVKTENNTDGSTSTIVTDKKTGTVTETAKYPDGAKVVTTTPKTGATQSVITLQKAGKKTTVMIPTPKKPEPGVVAVIMRPDGSSEVVKTSVATADGMKITITEGATIQLVDNTKSFGDVVPTDWFRDSVVFAGSHALFGGTSEDRFSPNDPMTRAMLLTVLYRYEGASVKGADEAWYADAMAWAKEVALSDGTNPDGSITREQLTTMLYRYTKPADVTNGDASQFRDGDKVSAFASEAMGWAISTGLMSGKGNNTLDPQGSASRAEVATILMRFCENAT